MENKYFRNPGDLTDNVNTESKHFRPAGDLTSGLESESKFFRPMGDLVDSESDLTSFRNSEEVANYFTTAGNLNEINKEKIEIINNNEEKINKLNNNIDKINDYLLTVVSGKKYDSVCELGVLMGAGRMVVELKQLMKMVDEGYNIISAKVINADKGMIEIEFQRYVYDEEKMERWRRF